ncbi:MAG: hypothetical protein QOF40_1888 [Actinomycetota bacterium]|nr:hypothetical protein [Actinomycetota bacterium]
MSVPATARRVAATERPLGALGLVVSGVMVAAASAIAAALPGGAAARWFLAAAIAGVLMFLCLRSTVQGVMVTFLWLFMLGLSRRLASEVLTDPGRDPLLLVGVAAVAVLALRALLVGALRKLTPLAWAVLAFSVLVVVEMANPDNPSGFSRVAGLLVWVVPTLWFWVGRTLVDDQLARRLLYLVAGATTVVAVYGIAQSVIGFPAWDRRWIHLRGYAALYIGPDTVRPFGTYASAAEFGLACAVGAVLAATALFGPRLLMRTTTSRRAARRQRHVWLEIVVGALVAFLVTSLALVLSAIRTYLVLLVVALPVLYLVMRGRRAWRVLVPALLVAALALFAIAQIDPNSIGKDGAQAAIRRVVVAINDPFASNRENTDNTLQLHYENAKAGFRQAFEHPIGRGSGSTGIAGEHFGTLSTSTDFDISDAGIAFGVAGLALTLAIVIFGFVAAIRVARWRRTFERVALVGVLIASFGAWFQGAHYVMAPLLWLLLGRADAAIVRGREPGPSMPAPSEQIDADPQPAVAVS